MSTIYVQNSVSFTNLFSRIIFINSLSPIFFQKFNITNSFSRINLRIRKSSKKFVRIRTTSFWFGFAKSVLCCERPVLYGLVFKSFFPYLYYMVLSLSLFWVESLYPYSYPYYMVLFLSPFWVESLYGPPYPYYMVLSLSPFWVESLCSYPYVYIIVTFL